MVWLLLGIYGGVLIESYDHSELEEYRKSMDREKDGENR